jgi:hypothetical protein
MREEEKVSFLEKERKSTRKARASIKGALQQDDEMK